MRIVLLALCAAAVFGQVRNPHTTAADVAAGGKIFRSHCAECHGVAGGGGRGPSLQTGIYYHGSRDEDLLNNISDGIQGTAMPGVFFSPTQVWQIVAYVRSLSRTAEGKPKSGDPSRGGALFQQKQCLTCHLVHGQGGVMGPDLTLIGSQRSLAHLREAILDPDAKVLPADYRAKVRMKDGSEAAGLLMNQDTHMVQILDFAKGLRSVPSERVASLEIDKKSAMPSYKGQLTDAQLDDLVAYLWSLQRQPEKTQ